MDPRKREQLLEQLSAYLDDELTAAQRREVEAFLAEDAGARTVLAELRATSRVLGELPRARASDRLLEGIRTRLEREALLGDLQGAPSPVPRERTFGLRWVAAAAVIGLAFVTVYLIRPMSQRDNPVITLASKDQAAPHEDSPAKPRLAEAQERGREVAQRGFAETPAAAPNSKPPSAPLPPAELKIFASNDRRTGSAEREPAVEHMKGVAVPAPGRERQADGRLEGTVEERRLAQLGQEQADSHEGRSSQPAAPRHGAPVVALVELNTPTAASQQQAAQLLKERFAFVEAGDALVLNGKLPARAKAGGAPAAVEDLDLMAAGRPEAITQLHRDDDTMLGAKVARVRQVPDARAVILTRVLADDTLARTLDEVRSQWPAAKVRVLPAEESRRVALGDKVSDAAGQAGEARSWYMGYGHSLEKYFAAYPAEDAPVRTQAAQDEFGRGAATQPHETVAATVARSAAPAPPAPAAASHFETLPPPATPAPPAQAFGLAPASAAPGPHGGVAMQTAPADRYTVTESVAAVADHDYADSQPATGNRLTYGGFGGGGIGAATFDRAAVTSQPASQPAASLASSPSGEQGMIVLYVRLATPASQPVDVLLESGPDVPAQPARSSPPASLSSP